MESHYYAILKVKTVHFRLLPLTEKVGYRAVNLRFIFSNLRIRQRGLPFVYRFLFVLFFYGASYYLFQSRAGLLRKIRYEHERLLMSLLLGELQEPVEKGVDLIE